MSIRQITNDNLVNKNKLVHTKHGWMTYSSLVLAGMALPVIGAMQHANADEVSSVSTSQVQDAKSSVVDTNKDAKQNDSLANDNSVKVNAEYASMDNQNVNATPASSEVKASTQDNSSKAQVTQPQVTESKAGDVSAKKSTSSNVAAPAANNMEVKNSAVQSTAKSSVVSSSEVANAKVDETKDVKANAASNEVVADKAQSSSVIKANDAKASSSKVAVNDKASDVDMPVANKDDVAKSARLGLLATNLFTVNNNNEAMAAAANERRNYSFAAQAIKVTINYQENGKTIKTANLTTTTGSFDPNTDLPAGYQIQKDWSLGETPVTNGQITVNVPVEKKQASTSNVTPGTTNEITGNSVKPDTANPTPVDNIVVTINYQDESGKTIKTASQTVKNGASVNVQTDCPSGYNVKSGWSVSNMPVQDGKATLNVPVVKASATTVDGSSATTTTPSSIKATINYVFNGQTVAAQTVTVPNGANIDVSKGVPSGYQIQSGWQSGEIKSSDGKATITVPLVKAQSSANDGMVAVTINYKDGSNVVKSVVQNVKSGASVDLNAGVPQGYEIAGGFKPESINNITDGKATMDVPVQKVQTAEATPATDTSSKPATSTSTSSSSSVNEAKPSTSTSSSNEVGDPAKQVVHQVGNTNSSSTTESKPAGTQTSPSDNGSTTDKPSENVSKPTSDDGNGKVGDSGSTADKVTTPAGTGSTTTNGTNKPSAGTQQANGTPADVAEPSTTTDKNEANKPTTSTNANSNSSSSSDKTPSISGSTSVNDDKNLGSTTKPSQVAPDDGNGEISDKGSNKAQVITPAGQGSVTTNGTNQPSIGTQTAGSDHPSSTNKDAVNDVTTSNTTSEPQGVNSDDSKKPGTLNSNNADVSKINGSETDESKASEQPSLTVPKDKNDATNADIYPGEGIIPGSNGHQVSSLNGMTPYKDDTKSDDNKDAQVGSANEDKAKSTSQKAQSNAKASQSANTNAAKVASSNAQVGSSQPMAVASKEQSVATPSMVSEAKAANQIGSVEKQSSQIGSASQDESLPQTGDRESALVELGLLAASMIGLSAMGIEKKHE